ncbi:MAG TPA: PepSY-like domain-containing protein [Pirellulales bacterium]|nr:PepSY-like domain-containing protein [Pirellulales bacterium]
MKKLVRMGVAGIAFAFLSLASTLVGMEEEIPLDKLPKAVANAIVAKFPGAKLEEAVKETEDDTTVYEVELKQKEQEYVVSVTPEGKITEVEREIAVKDLPKAVTGALAKKYPHARLGEAEEANADGKTTYEIVVSIRVTVDPQGKILNEDAAEDEEDEEGEDDDGK